MKKFLENFWYYHKWKLLVALMVVMVAVNTLGELAAAERFDYSMGLVTVQEIPETLRQNLADTFADVLPDRDGDGQVTVQVHVYCYSLNQDITPTTLTEDDAVHLAADIRVGESCVFFTDEPQVFEEVGLTYGGACGDASLLEAFSGDLNGFVFYFPAAADSTVVQALG